MSWQVDREYELFKKRCEEDIHAALSQPLTITVWGPDIDGPGADLRRGLVEVLGRTHNVNIPENLPEPQQYEGQLKIWEAVQAKNSDLILLLPDTPGSIGELVYLEYPQLAGKVVVFCQAEYQSGYVSVALLRHHESRNGRVFYYHQEEACPETLIAKIADLLGALAGGKWLRRGDWGAQP